MINFATVIVTGSPELAQCGLECCRQIRNIFRPKRGPIVLFEECSNWHVHSMDRDKGTWNESSEAGVWVNKASGRIVHWRKKKRQRLSEERQGPAKRSLKSSADVAPVDDNGFARRAGEIIARAAHSKDAVHRRRGNRR
jgi:hypothetical protein